MQLIRLKYATHVVIQQLFNKIIYAYKFLFVIVLKDIRNFRCGFVISLALITFLTNPAIAMPHKAHSQSFPSISKIGSINTTSNNKVVILNFDDGYESQYTNAKPILDQYGYKATFYIICNYIGDEEEEQDNSNARMSWEDITELHKEGYDIGSHSMDHKDLSQMSEKMVDFEVGDSKQCLVDHGINPISFAYPFNTAAEDATVIDIVAKYYDIARRGDNPLMFLHCDGFKEKSSQSDCKTYSDNGELNFVNRYSIIGWSHDGDRKTNSYDDSKMLNRFIEVVNSQAIYNTDGTINAIPIVTWHRIDNGGEGDPGSYATTIGLFEKEIKYLHDNGFKVLTMADLGYDTNSNYLYLKR